jgi:hypothetical protein
LACRSNCIKACVADPALISAVTGTNLDYNEYTESIRKRRESGEIDAFHQIVVSDEATGALDHFRRVLPAGSVVYSVIPKNNHLGLSGIMCESARTLSAYWLLPETVVFEITASDSGLLDVFISTDEAVTRLWNDRFDGVLGIRSSGCEKVPLRQRNRESGSL